MKKILIVRTSAMGDIIMASQILPLLHQSFPGIEIDWVVESQLADLLRHNPRVHRLILWDKAEWRKLIRTGRVDRLFSEFLSLRNALQLEEYDLVLDLQGLLRTRVLTRLTKAKSRWGFTSKEGGNWLLSRILKRGEGTKALGAEYLYAIEAMGAKVNPGVPNIVVPETVIRSAEEKRKQLGLAADEPYVCLAPFTTRPQKHWIMDRWAPLAIKMHDQFGVRAVVLGGPEDSEEGEKIAGAAGETVINLAGKTPLLEALAIVQSSHGIIGVDTGLTHLGHGFHVPVVALFGSTCPYLFSGNPKMRILYSGRDCSPCKRNPTCENFDCMLDLSVDQVVTSFAELWESDVL